MISVMAMSLSSNYQVLIIFLTTTKEGETISEISIHLNITQSRLYLHFRYSVKMPLPLLFLHNIIT